MGRSVTMLVTKVVCLFLHSIVAFRMFERDKKILVFREKVVLFVPV